MKKNDAITGIVKTSPSPILKQAMLAPAIAPVPVPATDIIIVDIPAVEAVDAIADNPAEAVDANTDPIEAVDANTDPVEAVDANTDPVEAVDVNTDPVEAVDTIIIIFSESADSIPDFNIQPIIPPTNINPHAVPIPTI